MSLIYCLVSIPPHSFGSLDGSPFLLERSETKKVGNQRNSSIHQNTADRLTRLGIGSNHCYSVMEFRSTQYMYFGNIYNGFDCPLHGCHNFPVLNTGLSPYDLLIISGLRLPPTTELSPLRY